jgi:8-oxo-dGTP pyrophosphatase MutT (NUDIX family)
MPSEFDNPWTTVSSQPIYNNAWIAVREDQVIRPDGEPGIYGVVHMNNQAIGVVPMDADGNIYLVGQYRYTLDCYSWEIPEGGGDFNKDVLEEAQRELIEETGLVAARWELLGRVHLSNSVTDEEAFLYLATELTQREAQPEGTEDLQIRRVPLAKALRMVLASEITDSLSVIGILRCALRFGITAGE